MKAKYVTKGEMTETLVNKCEIKFAFLAFFCGNHDYIYSPATSQPHKERRPELKYRATELK